MAIRLERLNDILDDNKGKDNRDYDFPRERLQEVLDRKFLRGLFHKKTVN